MVIAAAGVAAAATIGSAAISASSQSKSAQEATQAQTQAADAATALQERQWLQARQDIAPWRQAGVHALGQMQGLLRRGPGAPFQAPPRLAIHPYAFRPPTPESLVNDPGYQFRLRSGQQALEGSAAARGGLLSGGTLRGLTTFGQELGSQEYQQAYNRALGQNELSFSRASAANQDRYNRALQQWQLGQGLQQQQYNRLSNLAGVGQTSSQYLGNLGQQYATQAGELALQRGNALSQGQLAQGQAWGNFAQSAGNALGGLGGMYLARPQSPAQSGYQYNMNSQPYNPWEFM